MIDISSLQKQKTELEKKIEDLEVEMEDIRYDIGRLEDQLDAIDLKIKKLSNVQTSEFIESCKALLERASELKMGGWTRTILEKIIDEGFDYKTLELEKEGLFRQQFRQFTSIILD